MPAIEDDKSVMNDRVTLAVEVAGLMILIMVASTLGEAIVIGAIVAGVLLLVHIWRSPAVLTTVLAVAFVGIVVGLKLLLISYDHRIRVYRLGVSDSLPYSGAGDTSMFRLRSGSYPREIEIDLEFYNPSPTVAHLSSGKLIHSDYATFNGPFGVQGVSDLTVTFNEIPTPTELEEFQSVFGLEVMYSFAEQFGFLAKPPLPSEIVDQLADHRLVKWVELRPFAMGASENPVKSTIRTEITLGSSTISEDLPFKIDVNASGEDWDRRIFKIYLEDRGTYELSIKSEVWNQTAGNFPVETDSFTIVAP